MLALQVIKQFVERFDLRLAIEDTISDLSSNGLLLSRHLAEVALQLLLIAFAGLCCGGQLLVDLILQRCCAAD